ncbi:hypothetical protein BN2156_01173 [Mycolicibacterium neworleansense]|uniref:Uncharacterized protein n=1 Tax=Mycolicibacterium neworleansense TaxID=146018 RepID=A0A0H5RJK9_9MYCO|nr:hypothetical protein BN2156_01173 [Mycolicibacterium neworleansense]
MFGKTYLFDIYVSLDTSVCGTLIVWLPRRTINGPVRNW